MAEPGLALASVIACRSEPAPLSFVLTTVYVSAPAEAAAIARIADSRRVLTVRQDRLRGDMGPSFPCRLSFEPSPGGDCLPKTPTTRQRPENRLRRRRIAR